jgi:hypothetical protein
LNEGRRLAAHHEAAHAVADQRFGYTIHGVSISGNHDNGGLGRASKVDTWLRWEAPPEGVLEEFVVGCLAGFVAEDRLAPDQRKTTLKRAKVDFENVAELLRVMGELDRSDPDDAIPDRWIERASVFVNDNWTAITVVAEALNQLEELYPEEVEYLVHVADGELGAADDLKMWCDYKFYEKAQEGESRYRALLSAAGVDAVSDPTKGAGKSSYHRRPGSQAD